MGNIAPSMEKEKVMRKLGYLFLVATLGSVILAPTLAQAGEGRHHRDRGHTVRPAPPQLSYTQPHHVHNQGHHNHWKPKHRRHWRRHWRHHRHGHWHRHHRGHWKRRHFWKHHRHQARRHYYAPPAAWRHSYKGDRYSHDAGSVDFNINYRLFF